MKGYIGKILFVNLSNGEIRTETIPDEVYEQFLAGVGLGAYVLYQQIPAGADPLGPENMLGFVSGLLTGAPDFETGRWMVVCKSPLTGGWGDANCGGSFSPAIKRCGVDSIFINGTAAAPVYLYVDDQGAEIRPADKFWGLDAVEAEELLKQENQGANKPEVAVIGTSGEKLSLISGICNDGGRIAARSGVGAVMGSKRLKAVVLAGSQAIGFHDPEGMKAISKGLALKISRLKLPAFVPGGMFALVGQMMGRLKKAAPVDGMLSTLMIKKWGSSVNNALGVTMGDTPIKNWSGSVVDFNRAHYRRLSPDQLLRRETRKYHCYGCTIGCGGIVDLQALSGGKFEHSHKPEYETCAAFGGLLMNRDLDTILLINELLNRAGLDSISAGGTVAFAIECYQNGVLTPEMTGGLELKWGDAPAILRLVKLMIARQGIGDLLADGVKAAVRKLGPESSAYAMQAGGQEPGMHDSRMDPQLGLHFSADPTPGRHTIGSAQMYDVLHLWEKVSWAPNPGAYEKAGEYIPSERLAKKTVAGACFKQVTDGSGGCYYAMLMGVNNWDLFGYLNKATGWEKTPDDYMRIGKRIQTLRQMFNIKHGLDPWQSRLSARMAGDPPLKAGPLKGKTLQIDEMLRLHWQVFGWDESTGIPSAATLAALNLDTLVGTGV